MTVFAIEGLLGRLTDAVKGTDDVEAMNSNVRDKNEKVESSIDLLPVGKSIVHC